MGLTVITPFKFCLCTAVIGLWAGCSVLENSHRQKMPMMSAFISGDNDTALQEVNHRLREPSIFNSSVVNSGDELHWRLEAGSLNFHLGNYEECIRQLSISEQLINDYDERALINVRGISANAASMLTNLNALPYRGFCRDRIMLSFYKSLAYLGSGRYDSFRAQLRRMRNEQKKIQEDHRKFFDIETARCNAAKKENPNAAKLFYKANSVEKISASSRNQAFSDSISETRKIAHRGYAEFLNPAAIWLSGIGSLRDRRIDNARIDFQRLYDAMPDNPLAQKYLVTLLSMTRRAIPDALQDVAPFEFPLDRDCVYVITANGRGAAFKQISIHFPLAAAWQTCQFYPAEFSRCTVTADNRKYESVMLADMDGIFAREYDELLPLMIFRTIMSTAIKESAKHTATYFAEKENEWVGAAVYIGASIYNEATNTADTRSWEILPKEILLTQFPMPANRRITFALSGKSSASGEVVIPENCRSAIILINSPSSQNTACHILPIFSE